MSKSNDVSTLDHRPLADSELDAVSGGTWGEFISTLWPRPEQNHPIARRLMADL